MKKNLTLSFNHKAKYTHQAVLINGEPVLTLNHAPSFEKFARTSLMVIRLIESDFSIEKLAKTLADSSEDGVDLAVSAIACGDLLTEISPEYRAQGAMLLMAHILGNQSISVLIEETQTVGMAKYLNIETIDHDEMYTLTTLISMIVYGMVMAAETKMFHSK